MQKPSYEDLEQRLARLEEEIRELAGLHQEILSSERLHRTILENISDTVILTDDQGAILYVCPNTVLIFGFTQKEIYGLGNIDKLLDGTICDIAELKRKSEIVNIEWTAMDKAGMEHHLLVTVKAVDIRGGTALYVMRDATDLKLADAALKERESFIEAVMDNLPIGLAVNSVDPDVTFAYMNDNFPKFYRTTREALANPDTFWTAVYEDPQFRQKIKKRVLADCASGDPSRMYWPEVPITRAGQETAHITARNIPIPDKKLVISTVWDVTERKALEAELRQAHKMEAIGALAGGIAHDFNNILSSIIGFAELSLEDVTPGTEIEDNLNEIFIAGKRARDLIRQILTYARQSELKNQPVQVSLTVNEALNLLRSSIPTFIRIDARINSDALVMADPTMVHQIIMNLCTNAYHAMEETGGVLTIELDKVTYDSPLSPLHAEIPPGSYLVLTVADTGVGIPAEIKEAIFDPYFTTKDTGKGTGMGLAVVHSIVKSYHGRIAVESQVGKGTRFSVYLPITTQPANPGAGAIDAHPVRGTERIAIVDDEPAIVKMLQQILSRLGYVVVAHTSPTETLALIQSRPHDVDLVITDMTMPEMPGDILIREMRKIRPDIPVILCTGYSSRVSKEKADTMGIQALAHKPFDRNELARMVREVLDMAKG